MRKIVILDADTLGHDIKLDAISKYGELTAYPITKPSETADRIRDAEIIITNKVFIGKDEIAEAKNLRLVCVAATGYNNIDLKALSERNIAATNVKGYSTQTVAQLVFASILNIYGSISLYNSDMREGQWQQSPTFTMLTHPISDLENKTLGIIGYGNIGRQVAKIAQAFDMKTLICALPGREYPKSENRVDFDTLLSQSDIISLHCPLTPDTQNLISEAQLKKMKPSAVLINTSRGPVVNYDHLYQALANHTIKAAAFDVYPQEPPKEHPIFSLSNAYITPHIAWASVEARTRLVDGIANNIKVYTEGKIDTIRL